MKKPFSNFLLGIFATLILLSACKDSKSTTAINPVIEGEQTIAKVTELNEAYTTLNSALESTGLLPTFEGAGPFTIFAPTDAAFAKLPEGTLESLTVDQLADILKYHVVEGAIASSQLNPTQDVTTLGGQDVLVEASSGVEINGYSTVIDADFNASNGIIHAIDEVLLPAGIREANIIDKAASLGTFNTLLSAVTDAGLTSTLSYSGDLTVFAPTDEAFGNLPDGLLESLTTEQLTEILTYHVIGSEIFSTDLDASQTPIALSGEGLYVTKDGSEVKVNGSSSVITADVDVSNGVIHAIDEVLLPNEFLNIVQIASKNYDLTTLVSLVADQGLVPTLEGEGPFTLFAPINSGFDAISDVLETLTSEQVTEVLTYHVVAAKALSSDLSDGQTITTIQGEDISVAIDASGNVTFNGASSVLSVDIEGTNGVIHLIDGVLLPPSYSAEN